MRMKPRLVRGRGRGRSKDDSTQQPTPPIETAKQEEPIVAEVPQEKREAPVVCEQMPEDVSFSSVESASNVDPKSTKMEASSASERSSTPMQEVGASGTNSRSKILLLRKQLEENRLKFERQQRDNAEKRAAMDDMKERIEKLRLEVEQRDVLIQSLQEVDSMQHSDPNVQHLYQQIMHKDNTILELSDRVNHLESLIKDQEEQLSEKDQIISARTEAVSLITKDRDEKMMKTINELEELKQTMKEMQSSFQKKEEEWKAKSLESVISEKSKKIAVLEENCHRIESVRFELSARNAELQEKIVALQCDSKDVKKEFAEAKQTIQTKSEAIDDLKRKLVKAEAFGQKKLKALEKQIKSISDGGELTDQILALQNQIAELEEEKGNLQLKLVDFDELKTQCENLNETVTNSGIKIEQLSAEVLSQITAVTQLENEKIKLVEELNAKDLHINSLEKKSSTYQSQFEDMKQAKVTLELRLCEIEEERDSAIKRQKDLENEQKKMQSTSLSDDILVPEELQIEISNLKAQLKEENSKVTHLETVLSSKEDLVKRLEEEKEEKISENRCLISFLAEKESLVSYQSIKIEKHDADMFELQEEMSSKDNDIKNLRTQTSNLQLELEKLQTNISHSENTISKLNQRIEELNFELETSKENISLLKASEKSFSSVLGEKENSIQVLEEEIRSLKEEIERKDSTLANHVSKIESLDSLLQSREKQMLNLESEIADKMREISQQKTKCTKYEEELQNLKQVYHDTESNLKAECEAISYLLNEKDNKIKGLENDLNAFRNELQSNKMVVSDMEQDALHKNTLYDSLLVEKTALANQVAKLEAELHDLNSNLDVKDKEVVFLQKRLHEESELIKQVKQEASTDLEKSKNLEEKYLVLEKQKEKLDEDNAELMAAIDAKESHCQQIQIEFQALISSKENEIAQLHQALSEKEIEESNLRASYSNEVSLSLKSSEDIKLELAERCNEVSVLKNEIAAKVEELKEYQRQLEESQQSLSHLHAELNSSKSNIEHYKQQMEDLEQKLHELSLEKNEKESRLNSMELTKAEKEQEISLLKTEIETKDAALASFQGNQMSDSKSQELENLKLYVEQLHEQINANSANYQLMVQSYEKRIEEEGTKLTHLQEVVASCKTELSQKEEEYSTIQASSDDLTSKLKYFEELSHSQCSNIQHSDVQIQDLSSKVAKLENEKLEYEEEIHNLKQLIADEKLTHSNLFTQYESLSQQILIKDEEIRTLQEGLSFKSTNEAETMTTEGKSKEESAHKAYEEENDKLKKQLKEAQQAIIHLETSLATQSSLQEASDLWGTVDLGEPSISEPSMLMQSSLVEKDKTLTVIQEQLKIALEDINAANDEKKILQHQMKTLEAELGHKDKKVSSLEDRISEFQNTIDDLNRKILQVNTSEPTIHSSQPSHVLSQADEIRPVIAYFGSENQRQGTREQDSASSSNQAWFKPMQEETKGFWDNFEASEDVLEDTNVQLDKSCPRGTELTTTTSEAQTEQVESVDEIKYRLSWYEENWVMWTEHYNQLQANYQAAEQQIITLKQEIEMLKNTCDSSKQETLTQEQSLANNIKELNEMVSKMNQEKTQLEETIKNLHEEHSSTLNALKHNHQTQIEEINEEVSRLKGYETHVYELQSQIQTLQHQVSKSLVFCRYPNLSS